MQDDDFFACGNDVDYLDDDTCPSSNSRFPMRSQSAPPSSEERCLHARVQQLLLKRQAGGCDPKEEQELRDLMHRVLVPQAVSSIMAHYPTTTPSNLFPSFVFNSASPSISVSRTSSFAPSYSSSCNTVNASRTSSFAPSCSSSSPHSVSRTSSYNTAIPNFPSSFSNVSPMSPKSSEVPPVSSLNIPVDSDSSIPMGLVLEELTGPSSLTKDALAEQAAQHTLDLPVSLSNWPSAAHSLHGSGGGDIFAFPDPFISPPAVRSSSHPVKIDTTNEAWYDQLDKIEHSSPPVITAVNSMSGLAALPLPPFLHTLRAVPDATLASRSQSLPNFVTNDIHNGKRSRVGTGASSDSPLFLENGEGLGIPSVRHGSCFNLGQNAGPNRSNCQRSFGVSDSGTDLSENDDDSNDSEEMDHSDKNNSTFSFALARPVFSSAIQAVASIGNRAYSPRKAIESVTAPRPKPQPVKRKGKHAALFACAQPGCDQSFPTRFSLKRHQKRHTGERPFKCELQGCQRRFAEKSTLERHQRSNAHAGTRLYGGKRKSDPERGSNGSSSEKRVNMQQTDKQTVTEV
eukprot:gb/GEZN01002201.1/.p1 GENE.gb/GEZN01002201.1/~~gb/GEZN01002201.1/.p1  ORF type:complete len:571 (-),score=78.66 gb/GEZN01002201.1/:787-2499(-)